MRHANPLDPPRRRANQARGHGTFANDRPPVAGVSGRETGLARFEVLETVAEAGALRVVSSRLEAEGPVNDRFVSCARSVIEGKRFPVTDTPPGTRLRLFIPLGPNGNSLSLPASSLTDAEAEAD